MISALTIDSIAATTAQNAGKSHLTRLDALMYKLSAAHSLMLLEDCIYHAQSAIPCQGSDKSNWPDRQSPVPLPSNRHAKRNGIGTRPSGCTSSLSDCVHAAGNRERPYFGQSSLGSGKARQEAERCRHAALQDEFCAEIWRAAQMGLAARKWQPWHACFAPKMSCYKMPLMDDVSNRSQASSHTISINRFLPVLACCRQNSSPGLQIVGCRLARAAGRN